MVYQRKRFHPHFVLAVQLGDFAVSFLRKLGISSGSINHIQNYDLSRYCGEQFVEKSTSTALQAVFQSRTIRKCGLILSHVRSFIIQIQELLIQKPKDYSFKVQSLYVKGIYFIHYHFRLSFERTCGLFKLKPSTFYSWPLLSKPIVSFHPLKNVRRSGPIKFQLPNKTP